MQATCSCGTFRSWQINLGFSVVMNYLLRKNYKKYLTPLILPPTKKEIFCYRVTSGLLTILSFSVLGSGDTLQLPVGGSSRPKIIVTKSFGMRQSEAAIFFFVFSFDREISFSFRRFLSYSNDEMKFGNTKPRLRIVEPNFAGYSSQPPSQSQLLDCLYEKDCKCGWQIFVRPNPTSLLAHSRPTPLGTTIFSIFYFYFFLAKKDLPPSSLRCKPPVTLISKIKATPKWSYSPTAHSTNPSPKFPCFQSSLSLFINNSNFIFPSSSVNICFTFYITHGRFHYL